MTYSLLNLILYLIFSCAITTVTKNSNDTHKIFKSQMDYIPIASSYPNMCKQAPHDASGQSNLNRHHPLRNVFLNSIEYIIVTFYLKRNIVCCSIVFTLKKHHQCRSRNIFLEFFQNVFRKRHEMLHLSNGINHLNCIFLALVSQL